MNSYDNLTPEQEDFALKSCYPAYREWEDEPVRDDRAEEEAYKCDIYEEDRNREMWEEARSQDEDEMIGYREEDI